MSLPIEEWRWIPGYHGLYEVSDQGQVRSHQPRYRTPRLLKPYLQNGYPKVSLHLDGAAAQVRVHRLVALAFLGDPLPGQVCRHLNDVKTDSRLVNLAWGSESENQIDAVRNGVHYHSLRTHCRKGHAYDEENTFTFFRNGREQRNCRECHRMSNRQRTSCDRCGAEYYKKNWKLHTTASCDARVRRAALLRDGTTT